MQTMAPTGDAVFLAFIDVPSGRFDGALPDRHLDQ